LLTALCTSNKLISVELLSMEMGDNSQAYYLRINQPSRSTEAGLMLWKKFCIIKGQLGLWAKGGSF